MKKHLYVWLMICAAVCLPLSGCSSVPTASSTEHTKIASDELTVLTIGTADSGGTMYPAGRSIAKVISDADSSIWLNLSASNGSSANVRALDAGEIDLGLVSGDVAYSAVHGQGEFEGSPVKGLRAIAALYPSLSQWAAPSSLDISYVHDLKGHSLSIGPQDSTTELAAKIALDTMDINDKNTELQNCGIGSGAELVAKGELDAVHGFSGAPPGGLSELTDTVPCTILKYTDEELAQILEKNTYYYTDCIPAGTYHGQDYDVPTFGIKCLLCVDSSVDENLVYRLTEILYEHNDELAESHESMASMLQDGFMCTGLSVPLHPGAEKFYQDNGLMAKIE